MASSRDTSIRLAHLEQILAQTTPATISREIGNEDAADAHLSSVPLERIRRLTVALHQSSSPTPDKIDAISMRLLLNEYKTAVAHLRAVTREAASQIDGAGVPTRQARLAVHRYGKSIKPR